MAGEDVDGGGVDEGGVDEGGAVADGLGRAGRTRPYCAP
jgi:hypothetical protein